MLFSSVRKTMAAVVVAVSVVAAGVGSPASAAGGHLFLDPTGDVDIWTHVPPVVGTPPPPYGSVDITSVSITDDTVNGRVGNRVTVHAVDIFPRTVGGWQQQVEVSTGVYIPVWDEMANMALTSASSGTAPTQTFIGGEWKNCKGLTVNWDYTNNFVSVFVPTACSGGEPVDSLNVAISLRDLTGIRGPVYSADFLPWVTWTL